MTNDTTIFDKIISKEIPAVIVFEDEFVLGFKDINPQAPIHVLFIPKVRIATLNDVNEGNVDYVAKLHLAAGKYAKEIGEHENGYRVVMNCNANGGQTVFHIHMHFLAGRQLTWPPG
ncbi:MAG: histidine triad nucleotide-binding protein [Xanthomonadales bacterium]|nr:histidine triad nucleotide-binding protein [Xanthomonadales bacterium]